MKNILGLISKHKQFSIYCLLALVVMVIAAFGVYLPIADPYQTHLEQNLLPPSTQHLLGTDSLGRDVFSRLIVGARYSVFSTLLLVALISLLGSLLGILAGYFGGILDAIIMRFADTMISFPDLILAIAVVGILGPSLWNSMIAIAIVSWTKYARLARSLVLKIRRQDYLAAARLSGTKTRKIITRYLIPNAMPTMVITAAMDIGSTMLSLAALSFLGFGVRPPTPEWGYMLSESRVDFQSSPWLLIFPGLAILIVVVIFNLLGDALRDVLDPYQQTKTEDLATELVTT